MPSRPAGRPDYTRPMRRIPTLIALLLGAVAHGVLGAATASPAGAPPPAPPAPPPVSAVAAPAPAAAVSSVSAASSVSAGPIRADTSAFTFDSFDAEYTLSRGEDRRSTLRTVERLVARFPDTDQNRGIQRAIPISYDGHRTELAVRSVTDEHGAPRAYTSAEEGDFLVLTIAVPEGQYAHGANTYVIEYTQRDVTKAFANSSADEFYWDVNGTGWAQPFGRVSATLTVDPGIAPALTGASSCYRGWEGSTERCEIGRDGTAFSVAEDQLGPHQNVTLAVGFAEGTFAGAPFRLFDHVPPLVLGAATVTVADAVMVVVMMIRNRRGARTGRAIVAQYEPPEGVDAALAAEILGEQKRALTATLLDLAVRRRIRLRHDAERASYGAEFTGGTVGMNQRFPLTSGEEMFLARLFGRGAKTRELGATVWFTRGSTALGDAGRIMRGEAASAAKRKRLRADPPKWPNRVAALGLLLALVLLALHCLLTGNWTLLIVVGVVGIQVLVWGSLLLVALLSSTSPLTREGALLRDHLMGLQEYIRLAEADRIRMLQSVSALESEGGVGGQSAPVGSGAAAPGEGRASDRSRIVEVTERLLPYAVLFGLEREWQAELAKLYQGRTPEWVAASSISFTDTSFFSNLNSSVQSSPTTSLSSASSSSSSWSSSSSFSSDGGSSGGGFSGGGGGGGGGGGV